MRFRQAQFQRTRIVEARLHPSDRGAFILLAGVPVPALHVG
jgi:hypothetical protein